MAGADTLTFTDQNFEDEVLNSDKPVLVDFWAEWCGPCKALGPVIDELASDYAGKVKVGKFDTTTNTDVPVKFSISALPTIMIFKDGSIVEKFMGLRGKADFAQALDALAS
jgi:thioredoxin 1